MLKPGVLVVAGDKGLGRKVYSLLTELEYRATITSSLKDLEQRLQKDPEVVVILDLDSVQVSHQFLKGLRKVHPQLQMLGVSRLSYHPGLEEVIGSHLMACLVEPVDVDELGFWLKSIGEHSAQPGDRAEG